MQLDDVYRLDFTVSMGSGTNVSVTRGTLENIYDCLDISSFASALGPEHTQILEEQVRLRGIGSVIPQIHKQPIETKH